MVSNPANQSFGQSAFVLLDRAVSRQQRGAATGYRRVHLSPEVSEIVHAGSDAGDAFMIQRAPLPAIGHGVGVGAHLVGLQALQVLALTVENAHVRSEKLVARAHQKIAIQSANINRTVGRIVDRVDVRQRAFLVRQSDNFLHVIDGAHCIRGITDGHDPGAAC